MAEAKFGTFTHEGPGGPRMTKLHDLMNLNDLIDQVDAGNVRFRTHPDNENLAIYNYTEQAQYTRAWNPVTLQCRGLIVDRATREVLARPYDKFFNVGEYALEDGTHGRAEMHPDSIVRVVDKMDGSLGILYRAPDGDLAIATRGSFASDQAIHATEVLRQRYADWEPKAGMTYLFEIVFPENRIVLDYGDMDDLVLLGVRSIETGRTHGPEFGQTVGRWYTGWPGPRAEVFPATTFREALELGDRENREGLVITFVNNGLMVKVKQEDYVRLHKLVTGLNERVIWEALANTGGVSTLLEAIPDEFHAWLHKVADGLEDQFEILQGRAHAAYDEVSTELGEHLALHGDIDRKQYALTFRDRYPELAPLLFQLLDGRDISAAIWKTLKPKGQTESLMNRNEDVA